MTTCEASMRATHTRAPPLRSASPRERIDQTAYELFSREGIRAVGVDRLSARAGVTKMTLYRHYPSKDALALAFLRRREELWTRAWLMQQVERRAEGPAERLLAVFDVFDQWFHQPGFEGCSFINALLEHSGPEHPVRLAAIRHIATTREYLKGLAEAAGVRDAESFARQWQILMKGSIVAACEGDEAAAQRSKQIGLLLLAKAVPEARRRRTAATMRRGRPRAR
jgi:AcrR family transcriptional regulator